MEKRLTRSTNNQMIAGVAAGIANYFSIDPTIVRLIFVVTALTGGPGILAYLIMWVLMPEDVGGEKMA
jgi:phage shock protein PspC (stress-responsive transcriptional regulator)